MHSEILRGELAILDNLSCRSTIYNQMIKVILRAKFSLDLEKFAKFLKDRQIWFTALGT
jgi:hypothetical protein